MESHVVECSMESFGLNSIYFETIEKQYKYYANGELYAQRLQKLVYLYLFTDCFMKIALQSSEQICSDARTCS